MQYYHNNASSILCRFLLYAEYKSNFKLQFDEKYRKNAKKQAKKVKFVDILLFLNINILANLVFWHKMRLPLSGKSREKWHFHQVCIVFAPIFELDFLCLMC